MHRSGTSAVAAALHVLGLDVGSESGLMAADAANPEGYLEIGAIADLDDEILALLGGRWDAPPVLAEGWANDPALTPWVRRAMTTRASHLPGDRWLLKDPRVSLLLPLWRRAVLDRCAAVLVVRHPMETAWSIALRNGIPTMTGLALWAAYNRAALAGLAGLPVYVCVYDHIVTDPVGSITELAAALVEWGEIDADSDAVARAAAGIRPDLRRSTWQREAAEALARPAEIDRLVAILDGLAGRHDVFAPPSVPEAPWEEALLSERRFGIAEARRVQVERDAAKVAQQDLVAEVAAVRQTALRLEAELRAAQVESERRAEARREAQAALDAERASARETRAALRRAEARWQRLTARWPVRFARSVRRLLRPPSRRSS